MKILITGATGLIGNALVRKLTEKGHSVVILSRKRNVEAGTFFWDPEKRFIDDDAFAGVDSIIHLAGASIANRWTSSYKKELYSSRIGTANLLLEYCKRHHISLKSFISSSGINYYGTFTSNEILTEDSPIRKQDFLSQLSQAWEDAAYQFSEVSERVVCLRTAMVLSKEGGSFIPLKKITDFNLASPVGNGNQWMNWIHIEDLVNMYVEAVENEELKGNYNAVADETISNKNFMEKLAKKSNKFFLPIPVPGFILKLVLGEMSSIILEGTRASNDRIKKEGFTLHYPTLEKTLSSLIN